jgi:hypothetical protein
MTRVARSRLDLKNTHASRRPQSSIPDPNPPCTCQLKPKSPPVSCRRPKPYLYPPAQTRSAPSLPPQTKPPHTPASSSLSHAQYLFRPNPDIYQPA